jgi:hypothetical protein
VTGDGVVAAEEHDPRAGIDGVDLADDLLDAAEDALGDGERRAQELLPRVRRAEEIVRADGEHDRVRRGHGVADAFGAQARDEVRSLRAVHTEVDGLDGRDAAGAQLIVEPAGDAFTALVSGSIRERVAECDDVKSLRHGGGFLWRRRRGRLRRGRSRVAGDE